MLTAGATDEVPESPAKKPKLTAGATDEVPESPAKKAKLTAGVTDEVPESPSEESTSEESPSEETEEDDDDFYGDGQSSEVSEKDDDEFYGDGLHKMTDQERAMYAESIRRSDGFDVPPLPNVFALGLIQPANRNWPAEVIRRYAEFAIEDQNEKRKKEGGNQLRLKEVIKCNLQPACPANFYITLEAEDVLTGDVDEYEAMVKARCGKQKDVVHIFRKKNKPTINPPASKEHGPSDSDCAVEDPDKICESRSWDREETKRRRL